MTELRKMYWLHALTPLHVGEGFGIGAIDLPIVRERTTQWPLVPGSAVKGVIADKNGASGDDSRKNNAKLKAAFGMGGENLDNSGALMFTDARIVAIARLIDDQLRVKIGELLGDLAGTSGLGPLGQQRAHGFGEAGRIGRVELGAGLQNQPQAHHG